jgi:hypothetical protein
MEMCVPRKFKIKELLLDRMHSVLEHRSFSELSIRLLEQSLPAPRSGQGIQRQFNEFMKMQCIVSFVQKHTEGFVHCMHKATSPGFQ